MQMFKKPITRARQGDRVGICLPQLDANLIERGLAATPGSVLSCSLAIAVVQKIPYYLKDVKTK